MTLTKAEEIFGFENRKRTESWRNPSLAGFVQDYHRGVHIRGLYSYICVRVSIAADLSTLILSQHKALRQVATTNLKGRGSLRNRLSLLLIFDLCSCRATKKWTAAAGTVFCN